MKKVNLKLLSFAAVYIFIAGILFTGCKKDGDSPIPGANNIEVAVGTFKGKITVLDRPGPGSASQEYFNAIIMITKVGSNQLKITPKASEAYSDATPRTFTDVRYLNGVVQSNTVTGSLVYLESNKELSVSTEKQTASDRSLIFTGVKQ